MRALAIGLVGLLIGADNVTEAKKEMDLLEGTWSMVAGENDGRQAPEEVLKRFKRVARDGVLMVTLDGLPFMHARFAIDPSKKPKTIDYTLLEDGPDKGKMQLGIYEIDGDTIRFCLAQPGKDRPTDFTAKKGSERTYSAWKKRKK